MLAAFSADNLLPYLITGLTVGGIYSLSALGLVVVHRATGVVNFAQGAIGAIAALIYSQEFALKHRPLLLGLIVSIAVSVVLSFFYGFVMAPPRTPRRRGQGHRVPRVRPVHPRLLRMAVDRPGHGAQVAH